VKNELLQRTRVRRQRRIRKSGIHSDSKGKSLDNHQGRSTRGFRVGVAAAIFLVAAIIPAYAQVCSSPTVDTDGDGIPDVLDNCILVANPNQRDTSGSGVGNACNPDLNHDGIVDLTDGIRFAAAIAAFNSAQHTYTANADFNGDGKIDGADFAILTSYIGKGPGPSANVPSLSVAPLLANFKTPFVGVATTLPVTLKNTGCKPVRILGATLSGNASFQFFPPTVLTINAGETAVINVSFKPSSTSVVTANLTLATNTGVSPGAKFTVALVGAGVNPAAGQTPTLVAPSGVSFSTVSTGGVATQSLPISNTGTAPLVITGIQSNSNLITINPSLLGGFPITIPPGASVSIPVTLTAGYSAGPVNATLQIQSNDPLRSNASVSPQAVVVPAPLVVNNPVTGVQAFDGQTPINAANCSAVTRAVSFGAGTNSGDQFQVVMTDATGKSVTSTLFPAPSSPGTQILTGINVCGLADSTITTKVIYFSGGTAAPTFVGTPATKDASAILQPPTLTQPSAPYFTASTGSICGTARANTTVTITGGSSPVSTRLDASTTTFCMTVPLQPNTQNTYRYRLHCCVAPSFGVIDPAVSRTGRPVADRHCAGHLNAAQCRADC
jgi:hypothetical protein